MPPDPETWTRSLLDGTAELDESAASFCEGHRVPLHGDNAAVTALHEFRCSARQVRKGAQRWAGGITDPDALTRAVLAAAPTPPAPCLQQDVNESCAPGSTAGTASALRATAEALRTEALALGLRMRRGSLLTADESLSILTRNGGAHSRLILHRGEVRAHALWDDQRRAEDSFHAPDVHGLLPAGIAALRRIAARLAHPERDVPPEFHLLLMPEAAEAMLPELLDAAALTGRPLTARSGWQSESGPLVHGIDRCGTGLEERPCRDGVPPHWVGAADEAPRKGLLGLHVASGSESMRDSLQGAAAVLASRAKFESGPEHQMLTVSEGRLVVDGHRARVRPFSCAMPLGVTPRPCSEWLLLPSGHRLPVFALGPIRLARAT